MWHDPNGLEQELLKMDGVRLCMYANDGDLSCSLHRVAWISTFFAQTQNQ